mgnify:CR=1 FL=1
MSPSPRGCHRRALRLSGGSGVGHDEMATVRDSPTVVVHRETRQEVAALTR